MPRRAPPPYRPQLATLVADAPGGEGWVHETKYDGYRIGAAIERGRVTLLSRRGLDWTAQLPEVERAVAGPTVEPALLDGEIAVVLPSGSFQGLRADRPAAEVVRERAAPTPTPNIPPAHPERSDAHRASRSRGATPTAVAPAMLPHLRCRPPTLVHCPSGVDAGVLGAPDAEARP